MKNDTQNSEIIIYQTENNEVKIDVRLENDTVWLTQSQLADLYQSSKSNISEHIKHIFSDGELYEKVVVRKFRTTTPHGAIKGKTQTVKVNLYNLDMIISLGYRIKSRIATNFRIWATKRLNEYMRKGFTMDDEKLKNAGGGRYWYELLDRIRDIRSSEKVLYRQVLDLYATSLDYNPKSAESIKFFKIVQNKLHYAVHGNTASEVITKRANAGKQFMGLLSFSASGVSKKDIVIAKNYLDEKELKVLNNIVSAFFDLAEVKVMEYKPMYMKDWMVQLDKLVAAFDKKILTRAGSVSHKEAIEKAKKEYRKYQAKTLSPVEKAYLDTVKNLQKKVDVEVKRNSFKTKK